MAAASRPLKTRVSHRAMVAGLRIALGHCEIEPGRFEPSEVSAAKRIG
jgi:hypothetical protein